MTSQRCAYIMCVAMANDLKEVWASIQPELLYTYMAQYMPSFFLW
jgi:dehydrogenase/reductase SDR family protein 7